VTVHQTTLSGATVKGQGGPDSDDASLLNYVTVVDESGFAVGDVVTTHKASLGTAVLETDETAEHREIIQLDAVNHRVYFDRPLFLAHADGSYVTNARDLYAATVIGGPGLVWGVAALPTVIVPPVIDDFGRINRVSWYGIFDYSLLRDAHIECWLTAASM
jgi:hypothetical protein